MYDNNKEDLAKVTSAILELEKDLENANNLLKESKDIKYDELTAKVQTLINDITSKLNEARTKKQVLEDEKATEDARIKKLKEDLVDKTQKLQKAIDELNGANGIDNQEEALKSLKKAIQDAQTFDDNISNEDKTKNVKTEYDAFKAKLDAASILANNKTNSIQAAKDAIDAKVNAIETRVNKAIENANKAISENDKTKLENSSKELEQLVKDLAALATEISGSGYKKAIDKVTTLQTTVNDKKLQVDNALNAETNRINAVKIALEKALNDFNSAKQKVTDNQSNIDELTKALDAFRTQYNLSKTEYDKYNKPENTKIQVLKKALDDLNDALKTYKEFEKEEKQKLENKTNALDKRLEKAKENAKKAIDKYIAAGEDKTKIEDALQDLIASSEELEKLHTDATAEGYKKVIDESKKELDKVNEKIDEANEKLNNKTLKELKDLIKTLKEQITETNKLTRVDELPNVATFKSLIDTTQTKYEGLNNAQNQANPLIKPKLDELSTELGNANTTYATKKAELEAKKKDSDDKYKEANDFATPFINDSKSLDGKSVVELETLITKLGEAKVKAEASKSSAETNGYNEKVTASQKLINDINEAIEKVTQAKNKLEGENTQAENLIKQINEKIKDIDDKDKEITNDIKSKIDDFDTLINSLEGLNQAGIQFHNDENKPTEKPLAKRPDVSAAFANLKAKTDETSTQISTLKQTLEANKKVITDAIKAAIDKENEKRTSINAAEASNNIPALTQAIKDLKEILELAKKAQTLESQKGYSAKKPKIDQLVKRITDEITKFEQLLTQATQTEKETAKQSLDSFATTLQLNANNKNKLASEVKSNELQLNKTSSDFDIKYDSWLNPNDKEGKLKVEVLIKHKKYTDLTKTIYLEINGFNKDLLTLKFRVKETLWKNNGTILKEWIKKHEIDKIFDLSQISTKYKIEYSTVESNNYNLTFGYTGNIIVSRERNGNYKYDNNHTFNIDLTKYNEILKFAIDLHTLSSNADTYLDKINDYSFSSDTIRIVRELIAESCTSITFDNIHHSYKIKLTNAIKRWWKNIALFLCTNNKVSWKDFINNLKSFISNNSEYLKEKINKHLEGYTSEHI